MYMYAWRQPVHESISDPASGPHESLSGPAGANPDAVGESTARIRARSRLGRGVNQEAAEARETVDRLLDKVRNEAALKMTQRVEKPMMAPEILKALDKMVVAEDSCCGSTLLDLLLPASQAFALSAFRIFRQHNLPRACLRRQGVARGGRLRRCKLNSRWVSRALLWPLFSRQLLSR